MRSELCRFAQSHLEDAHVQTRTVLPDCVLGRGPRVQPRIGVAGPGLDRSDPAKRRTPVALHYEDKMAPHQRRLVPTNALLMRDVLESRRRRELVQDRWRRTRHVRGAGCDRPLQLGVLAGGTFALQPNPFIPYEAAPARPWLSAEVREDGAGLGSPPALAEAERPVDRRDVAPWWYDLYSWPGE
jgi:hypothetical protein